MSYSHTFHTFLFMLLIVYRAVCITALINGYNVMHTMIVTNALTFAIWPLEVWKLPCHKLDRFTSYVLLFCVGVNKDNNHSMIYSNIHTIDKTCQLKYGVPWRKYKQFVVSVNIYNLTCIGSRSFNKTKHIQCQ